MGSVPTKYRGVLIAFKRSTFFTLHNAIRDPEGRQLVLAGLLQDTEATLVTYYVPKHLPIAFLHPSPTTY